MKHPSKTNAFSLVEIMVVIAIAAVLVTLSISSWTHLIQAGQSSACVANLKALHTAFNNYASDNKNCYPPGRNPTTGAIWVQMITPYLSQNTNSTAKSIRKGTTFCPATSLTGTGVYKRDATTWRTDYNINGLVASAIEASNNRSRFSGSLFFLFDGGGASPTSPNDTKESARHNDSVNAIFIDGHVESLPTLSGITNSWRP